MQTPLYTRTACAWQALARPDRLDPRAHTLLLLANGRRTLRELSRLIDEDAHPLARRLADQGYLAEDSGSGRPALPDDEAA